MKSKLQAITKSDLHNISTNKTHSSFYPSHIHQTISYYLGITHFTFIKQEFLSSTDNKIILQFKEHEDVKVSVCLIFIVLSGFGTKGAFVHFIVMLCGYIKWLI